MKVGKTKEVNIDYLTIQAVGDGDREPKIIFKVRDVEVTQYFNNEACRVVSKFFKKLANKLEAEDEEEIK